METARGQTTHLLFQGDGTVRAAFGESVVTGRWEVVNRNLCFYWTGAPRECWPYPAPFRPGETRTFTSDRGNVVRLTRPYPTKRATRRRPYTYCRYKQARQA